MLINTRENGWVAWRAASWRDRIETTGAVAIAAVIGLAMFACLMLLIGGSFEGIAQMSVQHDRCLKNATKGYEIRQCR